MLNINPLLELREEARVAPPENPIKPEERRDHETTP